MRRERRHSVPSRLVPAARVPERHDTFSHGTNANINNINAKLSCSFVFYMPQSGCELAKKDSSSKGMVGPGRLYAKYLALCDRQIA